MAQTIDLNCQWLRRNISEGLKQSMQRAGLAGPALKKFQDARYNPLTTAKLRQPKFTQLLTQFHIYKI
jgi:hypothetical protein